MLVLSFLRLKHAHLTSSVQLVEPDKYYHGFYVQTQTRNAELGTTVKTS